MARRSLLAWIAPVAGMGGPVVFTLITAVLTVIQYDFMRGLGWHPVKNPDLDWPSGLALGPYGWLQIANFALSGMLLMLFAVGLHRAVAGGDGPGVGPALLAMAGVAMVLLAFQTDPTLDGKPRTWHGWIHDSAFVLLVASLVAAFFPLWRRFGRDPLWRTHSRYTLATGILAVLSLLLPGIRMYLFLAVALVWIEVTALRLWGAGKESLIEQ